MDHKPLNEAIERLRDKYPGWHFWISRGENPTLMATRKDHITDDLVRAGLARYLPTGIGQDIDLEQQLLDQIRIERDLNTAPVLT